MEKVVGDVVVVGVRGTVCELIVSVNHALRPIVKAEVWGSTVTRQVRFGVGGRERSTHIWC